MKRHLIQEWRRAHTFASVQIATVAVIFGLLPLEQQMAILALIGISPERAPAAIGALFIIGRLWNQPQNQRHSPDQE